MTAYYNENDPYCAEWLKNLIAADLIAPGDVDPRSILDVKPYELAGYAQCHFFAGLGGWSRALRLAYWPDHRKVWTGSCPCQPFSAAGKRAGFTDERHLWPYWHHLICVCRPAIIFGEQVARAHDWLALVRGDLEAVDYAVGAMPIEAASVGANHKRDRYWFVAYSEYAREGRRRLLGSTKGVCACTGWTSDQFTRSGVVGGKEDVAHADKPRLEGWDIQELRERAGERTVGQDGAHATRNGWKQRRSQPIPSRKAGWITGAGWWDIEPDVGRVADGVPARVAKLRALGNAIVPQVAAEFIKASRECHADAI